MGKNSTKDVERSDDPESKGTGLPRVLPVPHREQEAIKVLLSEFNFSSLPIINHSRKIVARNLM